MRTKALSGLQILFAVCFTAVAAGILVWNGAVLAVVCLLCAFWVCGRRLPRFTLLLFAGAFLVRLAAMLYAPPIVSDFYAMYQAALKLNAGDLSYLDTTYFSMWAYQNGFVLWQALLLRIWNSPVFLRLVNAALSAGSVCLLYRMAKDWVRPRAARMAGVLAALCPFGALLSGVLTNQIASAFFLVLGLWLLVCHDCDRLHFWRYPLAGLSLQIGNILRPEGLILLVAVAAWAVFSVLEEPARLKKLLCGLAALLVVYSAAFSAADAGLRATGLSPNGLDNENSLWKFVTGLNPDSRGSYSASDWAEIKETLQDGTVTEETLQLEKSLIRERIGRPVSQLVRLMLDKIQVQWCEDGLYWIFGPFEGEENTAPSKFYTDLCREFDRAWFYLALATAALGLVYRRRSADQLLPYFVMFAAFCAFLLVEVQARYAYMPQMFVFLSAAFGFDRLEDWKRHA